MILACSIIVIAVATIIIIIFSILVKRKKPNEIWNWWISFTATLLSLMLGVGVGVFLFEYGQYRARIGEKERLTASLEAELTELYRLLNTSNRVNIIDKNDQKIEALLLSLDQITVNEAIRSNLFSRDVTNQLIFISRNIRILDTSVNNLWAFLNIGGIYKTDYRMGVVKTMVSNIEKFENNIKKSIEKLRLLLGINLKMTENIPTVE